VGVTRPILYPKAVWEPLTDHSAPGSLAQRQLIVLHITDGSTAEGAIETFRTSVHPNRVSAHFVIDRDGTVIQLVDINDTAWHASEVNSISVGIEHVAVPETLMATEAQYSASAALVAWLCGQMEIPCDRNHVKTHNEASPQDGHVLCCTGALNPDRVVVMASAVSASA
jgi:N-acetyl-anhydromuramyl-L-alanine amidase AmpD